MDKETPTVFKSGFIAVAGRPNVGKSTLINALLGQKISAVSPKPQTTRRQQLGILTTDLFQFIFIDTPGIHQPRHLLGEYMNEEASQSFEGSDLILWIVDARFSPHEEDLLIADLLGASKRPIPVMLALNKIDQAAPETLASRQEEFLGLLPHAIPILISARKRDNLDTLLKTLADLLPEGLPYYPEDQITDAYERDLAADFIRAAALLHLRDEIPHSMAVRVDEFKERGEQGAYIAATLLVERESQKPIVIGKGGEMLKKIGVSARSEIEGMSGRKIYLKLRVKVRKNWRNDRRTLQNLGFKAK